MYVYTPLSINSGILDLPGASGSVVWKKSSSDFGKGKWDSFLCSSKKGSTLQKGILWHSTYTMDIHMNFLILKPKKICKKILQSQSPNRFFSSKIGIFLPFQTALSCWNPQWLGHSYKYPSPTPTTTPSTTLVRNRL